MWASRTLRRRRCAFFFSARPSGSRCSCFWGFLTRGGLDARALVFVFGLGFLCVRLVCFGGGAHGCTAVLFAGGGHRCTGLPLTSNVSNTTAGAGVSISSTAGCLDKGRYIATTLLAISAFRDAQIPDEHPLGRVKKEVICRETHRVGY